MMNVGPEGEYLLLLFMISLNYISLRLRVLWITVLGGRLCIRLVPGVRFGVRQLGRNMWWMFCCDSWVNVFVWAHLSRKLSRCAWVVSKLRAYQSIVYIRRSCLANLNFSNLFVPDCPFRLLLPHCFMKRLRCFESSVRFRQQWVGCLRWAGVCSLFSSVWFCICWLVQRTQCSELAS